MLLESDNAPQVDALPHLAGVEDCARGSQGGTFKAVRRPPWSRMLPRVRQPISATCDEIPRRCLAGRQGRLRADEVFR